MYIFWFIFWLAFVFLFISELFISSLFWEKPGLEILVMGIIIFLPIFRSLVTEVMRDFSYDPLFSGWNTLFFYWIVVAIVIIWYKFHLEISTLLLLIFLCIQILLRMDGRISFLIALTCLVFCLLQLILESKIAAETFAIYAYYFLVIGVVSEIFTSVFNKKIIHEVSV